MSRDHLTLVGSADHDLSVGADADLINEYAIQADVVESTRQRHRRQLLEFRVWLSHPKTARGDGPVSLLSATRADVVRFLAYLAGGDRYASPSHFKVREQLMPSTRKSYLAALHSFYGYFVSVDMVVADPTAAVQRPKVKLKRGLCLTADELRRLLAVPGTPRDRLQAYLLAFTGARVSEITDLRWRDLNLIQGTMLLHGKGDKERLIFIHPRLMPELRRWQLRQDARAEMNPIIRKVRENPDTDFVLVTNKGQQLARNAIYKQIKRRATRAGLYVLESAHRECRSEVSPHTLRRTFATLLLNDGEHIDAVADVLGHESIDTTRKHYAFASNARMRATIEAFKI